MLESVVSAASSHADIEEVLVAVSVPEIAERLRSQRVRPILIKLWRPNLVFRTHWLSAGFAELGKQTGADASLCLAGGGAANSSVPAFVFLQQALLFDDTPKHLFNAVQQARLGFLRPLVFESARSALAVFVQTQTMAEMVRAQVGLPEERIHVFFPAPSNPVVPSATDATCLQGMRDTEPERRFLYVGYDYPYKNLGVLQKALELSAARDSRLRVFATLPRAVEKRFPALTCVGELRKEDLSAAYQVARGLIMPSLCETVGLPLIEAMRHGVPAVAADLPYAREVCGPAASYFDPYSPAELATALSLLSTNDELWREKSAMCKTRAENLLGNEPYKAMISTLCTILSRPSKR